LQNEPEAEDAAEDQGFYITDNVILEALEMMSFASIRQITKMIFIPPATVFRRLTKSLHVVLKRLPWVPHGFSDLRIFGSSDLQNQVRVIMPKELLRLLEFMRHHSWKYMMTRSEAWFYLSPDHESIWFSPEDETLQKRVISEDDADHCLEPTRISLD
jgi:hypothetical protein